MTTTPSEAVEAMLAHHRMLDEQLKTRVAALTRAVAAGGPHEQAAADLVAYLAGDVLTHAEAEELTIYRAAAAGGLAAAVSTMIAEHCGLSVAVERLTAAPGGPRAAEEARQIAGLFSAHVAKENLTLLPGLLDQEGVDLAGLLAQMRQLTEDARKAAPGQDAPAEDPRSAVAGLPVDAAAGPQAGPELDVRSLAPAQRHRTILGASHALAPGTGFVLVNDHDPKPLRYQLEAEHPGEFTWDTIDGGPAVWRVRISRSAAAE